MVSPSWPGVRRLAALALACAVAAVGCGGDDDSKSGTAAPTKVRLASERIEAKLDVADQEVVDATPGTQRIQTEGGAPPQTMDEFLTRVIRSVDRYWTTTLTDAGAPEPSVNYLWIAPGQTQATACKRPDGGDAIADDDAAFYCSADDTIYVAQRLAAEVWDGIRENLPGESAGYGRAIGDFGVAYMVAHEYGHNIQQELGFRGLQPVATKGFELQADCFAGLWGNSVYFEGLLDPGDIEEALSTALAVGDFDFYGEDHHGTPDERQRAWSLGFGSGDPSRCNQFLQS